MLATPRLCITPPNWLCREVIYDSETEQAILPSNVVEGEDFGEVLLCTADLLCDEDMGRVGRVRVEEKIGKMVRVD